LASLGDIDTELNRTPGAQNLIPRPPPSSPDDGNHVNPRVLIVDEHNFVSEGIREALQQSGVDVLGIATTADGAVAALSEGIADAVIFCLRTQTSSNRSATATKPQAPAVPVVFAPGLTARERQVLRLLVEGASNKEMARRLAIRSNTVRTHVQNLLGKLRVHTRLEAVTLAMRAGFDEREENIAMQAVTRR
jgi:DNA-binding NarL/FixJ family response regulator